MKLRDLKPGDTFTYLGVVAWVLLDFDGNVADLRSSSCCFSKENLISNVRPITIKEALKIAGLKKLPEWYYKYTPDFQFGAFYV